MNNQKKVYFKEIPSFITTISNHLGYQIQIMQVKDMFSLNYDIYSKEEEKIKDLINDALLQIQKIDSIINEDLHEYNLNLEDISLILLYFLYLFIGE